MTYPILKTTGKIVHYGEWKSKGGATTYAVIEVQTDAGLVELKNVVGPTSAHRVVAALTDATIMYSQGEGKGAPLVVWGVLDHETGRVFTSDDCINLRKSTVALAIGQSVGMTIATLVGLCVFLIPGLLIGYSYYKTWQAALAWPTSDDVNVALAALKTSKAPVFAEAAMA